METAMPATLWRVRSSMAWWGGRRCRDGALKHAGWAREGWWPWLRRRRRRAPLGGVRGREEEEGTGSRGREGRCSGRGEVRGVRGRLGNASVEAGGGRGGIGARHRAASVRGEEEDKGRRWAGPAQVGCTVLGCGWLLGKVQVISVLYFSVLFCFYLILLPLFSNLSKFKTVPNIL